MSQRPQRPQQRIPDADVIRVPCVTCGAASGHRCMRPCEPGELPRSHQERLWMVQAIANGKFPKPVGRMAPDELARFTAVYDRLRRGEAADELLAGAPLRRSEVPARPAPSRQERLDAWLASDERRIMEDL